MQLCFKKKFIFCFRQVVANVLLERYFQRIIIKKVFDFDSNSRRSKNLQVIGGQPLRNLYVEGVDFVQPLKRIKVGGGETSLSFQRIEFD